MASSSFKSSDSVRSAAPLRHAQSLTFAEPLSMERGGELASPTVCFETYGTLAPDAGNAVLICHALSGDSHVAAHDAADSPGWWDIVVGPGKAVDTNQLFVICPNMLGGCRGTTGPNSINPATNLPYGCDFPAITTSDIVELQRRLIDHLGIRRLLAVIGGSMGGHQVLNWAARCPNRLAGAVAIATSTRLTSQALAFDIVGRNAILHDPNFLAGQYYGAEAGGASAGLAIARMIGHITYLSREAMHDKFEDDRYQPRDVHTSFEKAFSVGSYLGYQGQRFIERFDANSYIALTKAMDLFDLGRTREELAMTFPRANCRWLVLSFTSDWLFPPEQSQEIVSALLASGRNVTYCNVPSRCGHDAFLLEDDLALYGELIRAFLDTLKGSADGPPEGSRRSEVAESPPNAFNVFESHRLDYDRILALIPPGSSVLDLGCGQGELLCRLRQRGHSKLVGIELDEDALLSCLRNAQDVIHADLNRRLPQFDTGQFDVVVLSQTLQTVLDVEGVLSEMLRIGRLGIVSFPNFAYRKLRQMLTEEGRAPEALGVLHHKWYNTPNLRFFSIADFETLCREKGIAILQMLALDTEAGVDVADNPNLNADLAIFVLGR
ncbi:MAG: hypothetical protein A3K19_23280 [Lentisphaerae bacterium RIFOXYB12_FULL_65_16]|nr:MAG: hypothetical protein A3K18_26080 [Lentisphaerae bacterium RIFOXYA12_64_32]OGV89155.1 MAG: hypothetical protein A3K19_23280 [Lentisphaerae bacterium RIFOXYB12_FULL_65_16]